MPQINSRLRQKIDTEINWNKATNFIPLDGEIIIYKADENYSYERIKIGDGETTVINLAFINNIDVNLTQSGQAADAKAVGDAIENKVDKEEGKGLSTNDYTTDEKTKVAGIATNLVNGSAEGSLRSITSFEENEEYTMGQGAFAIGWGTAAIGENSIAVGSVSTSTGAASAVIGINCEAHDIGSFASGKANIASGGCSHAEGYRTSADGYSAHSEGKITWAKGEASHAEGRNSIAGRDHSHAEGFFVITSTEAGHAQGKYNIYELSYEETVKTITITDDNQSIYILNEIPLIDNITGKYVFDILGEGNAYTDLEAGTLFCYNTISLPSHYCKCISIEDEESPTPSGFVRKLVYEYHTVTITGGEYAHIVGNGESDSARSNAHTLDWSGNAWFSGDVYTGSTSGTNKDEGSKKLATEDFVNTKITYGTTDLTAGTSELATGTVYLVYE